MENDVERRGRAPARPCLVLATVVGCAALGGRALPAAAVCIAVATAAGGLCLWLVRRALAERVQPVPMRPPVAAWLALAGLAALVLGARAANVEFVPLTDAAVEGTWRRLPFERGRLELDDGRVLAADFFAPVAPPDGERVVLLPPFDRRACARGPVSGAEVARTRVVLAADQIVRLGVVPAPTERTLLARLRTELARRSHALPDPAGAPESGLAAALFVNDRSRVDGEVADVFKRTGTLHLLAISGMHVVLFAWLVAWPLRRGVRELLVRVHVPRPWPRRCGALAAGATIVVFSALAGGEAPIVRAAIAAVVVLLVRDWPPAGPRTTDTLALLALGLALELVADPLALENVGLVMSYGACLGLALGARPASQAVSLLVFGRALEREVDPLLWLGSRTRLVVAIVALRARRAIAWGLGSSIAATFGTLPTQWSLFGEFSPVGIVATPLVGPLMVPWLPALWLGALDPTGWIAWPQAYIEQVALLLLTWCDALPGTSLILPERPAWWIFGVSALALAALATSRQRDPRRVLERSACGAFALTLVPWTCAPRELEVYALDVGHGTCVVAQAPGLPLVVFDAGSSTRIGLERLALRPLLSRLDAGAGLLVLSHVDRDHVSGVPWLARRGLFALTAGAWPAGLAHEAPHVEVATPPGALDGPVRADGAARWRLTRGGMARGNEGSHNLELSWNGARVLLCGDATGGALARLVAEDVLRGPFDLVLLPHHGRHGVGTDRLLDELALNEVWSSSETPAPIEAELERRGVRWRSTCAAGPLGPWSATRPPHDTRTRAPSRTAAIVTPTTAGSSEGTRPRRPRRERGAAGARRPRARRGAAGLRASRCQLALRELRLVRSGFPREDWIRLTMKITNDVSKVRFAALLSALVVAAVGGPAESACVRTDAPVQDEDAAPRERAAQRLLVLEGGQVLRARARQRADGVWEYARGGEWTALEGVGVVSARLESEVLAEFAKKRTEQSRTRGSLPNDGAVPVHERLELAHWCESVGLFVEALEELDRAFDEHPGDLRVERHTLRFGERARFGFGLPDPERFTTGTERERGDALRTALATIARLGPSGRLLASEQLVAAAGPECVRAEVTADLRRSGPLGRQLACELIGRIAPGEETKVLFVRALLDTDPGVRTAGARALGRANEPGFVAPFERALASSNEQVQLNAAQALGVLGQATALPVIARALLAPASGGNPSGARSHVFIGSQYAYVQDFDVEVATAASIADPQIGVLVEGSVLDVRVLSTVIERTVVRRHLALSAGRLLGHSIGDSPKEWEAWAKATLERPPVEPPAEPPTTGN
jgi:competence protein ComEC